MRLERGHCGSLFGALYHLGVMLGSLLCAFEGPLESIGRRSEHSRMGLVSLRVYVNYFGITFVDFQKIHIFLMDFNDFMEFRGQLESTLGSFCSFRGVINSKMVPESAIRGSIGSKSEARGGPIGNLRRHDASKSAKYSKMQGKPMKTRVGKAEGEGRPGGIRGARL